MLSLTDGFRALIVGGTGAIGSAIVRAFVAEGAHVTATGIDDEQLAASGLQALTGVELATLDVTDDRAVRRLTRRLDRLDALINCAGILVPGGEYEMETFQHVVDVNLSGAFFTAMACRDALRENRGSIVNIASMNAYQALPWIPAYCASKGGLVMLTKSLALAWGEEGIRVNAVAPGYVETPINAEGRQDRAFYDTIAAHTALKRWAQPEDIAGTALFLCTPAARYITGSVLPVDGGFLAG